MRYYKEFNDRIHNLAEILYLKAKPQDFHERCQTNLGNLAKLPSDIHDHMIYALPHLWDEDFLFCIKLMKMFWKAPLGDKVIYGSIDVKKFGEWIYRTNQNIFWLNLNNEEFNLLLPYVGYLNLRYKKGSIFSSFESIVTCKNLQSLKIPSHRNFKREHFEQIAKLSKLKWLEFSDCSEINEGLEILSGLEKLSDLYLDQCEINLEGFSSLKKFKNLARLTINQLGLKDNKVLEHISEMKTLDELSLCNTAFRGEDFKHLKKSPSLKILDLTCVSLL